VAFVSLSRFTLVIGVPLFLFFASPVLERLLVSLCFADLS
jgi:hypothetical protein